MVDPVGAKPVAPTAPRALAPVEAPVRATPAEQASADTASLTLSTTTREMAARPPVDADRVARIRRAIQEGNFPILPATIADRMLAFKLNWNPDDAA